MTKISCYFHFRKRPNQRDGMVPMVYGPNVTAVNKKLNYR